MSKNSLPRGKLCERNTKIALSTIGQLVVLAPRLRILASHNTNRAINAVGGKFEVLSPATEPYIDWLDWTLTRAVKKKLLWYCARPTVVYVRAIFYLRRKSQAGR